MRIPRNTEKSTQKSVCLFVHNDNKDISEGVYNAFDHVVNSIPNNMTWIWLNWAPPFVRSSLRLSLSLLFGSVGFLSCRSYSPWSYWTNNIQQSPIPCLLHTCKALSSFGFFAALSDHCLANAFSLSLSQAQQAKVSTLAMYGSDDLPLPHSVYSPTSSASIWLSFLFLLSLLLRQECTLWVWMWLLELTKLFVMDGSFLRTHLLSIHSV